MDDGEAVLGPRQEPTRVPTRLVQATVRIDCRGPHGPVPALAAARRRRRVQSEPGERRRHYAFCLRCARLADMARRVHHALYV